MCRVFSKIVSDDVDMVNVVSIGVVYFSKVIGMVIML